MVSSIISKCVLVPCVILFANFINVMVLAAIDDSNDLIYTEEDVVALQKFREMVNESLTEDFMTTDYYLMRWIRSSNMDLDTAKAFFDKNIKWRNENNISSILEEDWTDIMEDYHFEFSGSDRQGRPIGTIDLGEWNLRDASVTGRQSRLIRYLAYSLEGGMHDLFRVREKFLNISRGIVLVDAGNLGMRTHLCASCLSILANWVSMMDNYYPQFLREIIIINAPYIIKIAHNALWPIMSSDAKNMIKSFNYNVKYWGPYLDERIDPSYRTPRYGGTRELSFDSDREMTNATASTAPTILWQ